jgi:predicted nucleotidyltransferase
VNSIHLTENQIIEKIIQIIKDHLHPRQIILFGSRAMGTSREYSDFDIALESEEMDIRQERILKEALDNDLGIYAVDLINLKNVDDEFKNLLEKGKVIYEHLR